MWAEFATVAAHGAVRLPTGFADSVVVRGLDFPVALAFAPDGRLFVGEQRTTAIHLYAPATGAWSTLVDSLPGTSVTAAEGGLLGLAVDPRWPAKPYLYTFATLRDLPMRVARYAVRDVAGGAPALDLTSRRDILDALRDSLPHHNGGSLRFGPDGLLYVSVGDDGDPCAAQQPWTMRGAVLRIDVLRVADGPGPAPPLADLRPADTPASDSPAADLAWAIGLRNPFRIQIDPRTGVVYAGDVGESEVEEIDRLASRGFNGAWPLREGPRVTGTGCRLFNYVLAQPAYWYDRIGVTAAVVCAGVSRAPQVAAPGAFPRAYDGVVFALDYYQGFVRALQPAGASLLPMMVPGMTDSAAGDWARGYESVADALVGPDGALWYCRQAAPRFTSHSGEVGRIAWTGAPDDAPRRGPFDVRVRSDVRREVIVSFEIPRPAATRVEICDAAGRLWRTLADAALPAGAHVVSWDRRDARGRRAPRGVLLVRVTADGQSEVARAVAP